MDRCIWDTGVPQILWQIFSRRAKSVSMSADTDAEMQIYGALVVIMTVRDGKHRLQSGKQRQDHSTDPPPSSHRS